MCGIAGVIDIASQVSGEMLMEVNAVQQHRGPDDNGIYINIDQNVGFGHTRLSFIDLSKKGHQPMQNTDKSLVITFNGEIYNFKSLRAELLKAGHIFNTETDTEVILNGYREWGIHLPEKLLGMFALAIYDINNREVFLARDHFGIKPLFYHSSNTQFLFSSEVKGILKMNPTLKKIKKESISLFLANRYIPTPNTIWENIYKIPPGHWLKLQIETMQMEQGSYWKLGKSADLENKDAADKVSSLITDSVQMHLVSDVEIGSFLSGGMDSSLLVYLMQKKLNYPTQAFAIGFNGWEQSEHKYAELVANALDVKLHIKKEEEIKLDLVKKLMWHYDDPIADISIIPTYEVCQLASKHVKAVVSGEGADECHAGYWWDKPEKFIHKNYCHKFKSAFKSSSFSEIKYHYTHAMGMGIFDVDELRSALTATYASHIPKDPFNHFNSFEVKGVDTIHQIQLLNFYTFMSDLILVKVDRASMAHSLEVRVPYLFKPMVEYLYNLKCTSYLKKGVQKPIIRDLLKNNVPNIISDRPKQGFVGPDSFYMNYTLYKNTLIDGRLVNDDVINPDYINKLIDNKDHWRLWKLFVLENWWQVWMS